MTAVPDGSGTRRQSRVADLLGFRLQTQEFQGLPYRRCTGSGDVVGSNGH